MESSCLFMADAAMHEFENGMLFALSIVIVVCIVAAISYVMSRRQSCDEPRISGGDLGSEDECEVECGCDEGECEWPCVCDEITKSEEARYFKELEARVDAQEKAEQEFWNNREVLVELWEPNQEGGGE